MELAYQFAEANAGEPIPEQAEAFMKAYAFFMTFAEWSISVESPSKDKEIIERVARDMGVTTRRLSHEEALAELE
jgi:hypothetical protein